MAALRRVVVVCKKMSRVTDYLSLLIKEKISSRKLHYSRETATKFGKDTTKDTKVNKLKINANFELQPSVKLRLSEDELMQYPIQRFAGNINIVKEPSQEHDLAILNVLNKLKHEPVLGLDVEMTESSREIGYNGRNKKTRVVQIASETEAIVWQLKNFTSLPSSLVFFLKSDILKVVERNTFIY